MSKPTPARYRTLNWSACNAALHERVSLTVWFDAAMPWRATPSGKRGAQPAYSDAAVQACPTVEVLFGLPLRRTTGFGASLLKLADLDWPVPDVPALCRRQRILAVQLPYRSSAAPFTRWWIARASRSAGSASRHAESIPLGTMLRMTLPGQPRHVRHRSRTDGDPGLTERRGSARHRATWPNDLVPLVRGGPPPVPRTAPNDTTAAAASRPR